MALPDFPGRPSKLPSAVFLSLRQLAGKFADIIVPPCCLVCRTGLGAHHVLCGSCWKGVHFIRAPLCDLTGIPLPFGTGERMISAAALAHPPDYDRARAVAHYSGVMQTLIHQFKYADRHDATSLFARWMAEAGRELLQPPIDVIAPVPLGKLRLLARRYNQAAILAGALARVTGVRADPQLLHRIRSLRSQVGLTHDQRRRNVSGAFRVNPRRKRELEGRRVLLVDDVITTGATAEACARVLKSAGASRVDVLALARVTEQAPVSV